MSSYLDITPEIDYGTTSADQLIDHQWYSDLSSLINIEPNASFNGMVGGYYHEEPMNPFSSSHSVTASYNEDAIWGLNDAFVPNKFPAEKQMMTLSSPFDPKDPIILGAGSFNNVLSLMAKDFAARSASRLDTMEGLKRNLDGLSSQVQDLKRYFDCLSSQVQDLKNQVQVAANDIYHLHDQFSQVRSVILGFDYKQGEGARE